MLKTLDPYTEFENVGQAKNMRESVGGRYGGVGLVISGNARAKTLPGAAAPKDLPPTPPTLAPPGGGGGDDVAATPAAAEGLGVTVVDAFEGYGFDAGLRVGDRLVSVGGVDTTKLTVDQVRPWFTPLSPSSPSSSKLPIHTNPVRCGICSVARRTRT